MRPLGLAVAAVAALSLTTPAQAQTVVADIAINQGPISGRVIIGDRYHPRPVYREYVVVRHYRGGGWYRNHGYRSQRVYWDGYRYYDRPYRDGLQVVWVYERGGRYYHDYRDDRRNDYRRRIDRRDDRHDRWDDQRGRGYDRDEHRGRDHDRNDRGRKDDRHDRDDDHRDRNDDRDRNDYRGRNSHR